MIHSLLILIWNVVAAIAACVTLPGSVELLLLSLAALLPRKPRARTVPIGSWRAAVVVPAHNEEVSIGACVQNLLQADPPASGSSVDIFVIADNCTDATARIAGEAGAQVLVRTHEAERGKGFALHFAFTHLLQLGYDCVVIVDADSRVSPNFLQATTTALRAGEPAVQARYLVHDAQETTRSRLMGFALRAFNVVRPLGRERLGLSCGIFGNGFGLRRETLLVVPYLAASLVEDLEYHLALVRSGRRVAFLNHATVYAETPVRANDVKSQRSRWEGGRLRMLVTKAPSLFKEVLTGQTLCIEPLLELLLLPLAFHVVLIAVAMTAPLPIIRDVGATSAVIVLLHLVATIVVGGGGWSDAAVLAVAPFYVLWKIMLIPTLLRSSRSDKSWVRTGRNAEPPQTTAIVGEGDPHP